MVCIQCCQNTLEFCQTSVWQNFRFCRTEQNFVRPIFFIKPMLNCVRCYFQSSKRKKYSLCIPLIPHLRSVFPSRTDHLRMAIRWFWGAHLAWGWRWTWTEQQTHLKDNTKGLVVYTGVCCKEVIYESEIFKGSDLKILNSQHCTLSCHFYINQCSGKRIWCQQKQSVCIPLILDRRQTKWSTPQ